LITGATGFLGSWLTKRLLEKEANITVLVRDYDPQSELIRSGLIHRTRVINGALEEKETVDRAINENEIEYVFHLGAQTLVGTAYRDPLATFESNIRGTYFLLDACRRHRDLVKGVIVASSDKAYGASEVLPYTEEMPLAGKHPYDVSKSCADLIASTYFHTYDLPVVIARCGNLFGGGDLHWSRLIPGTIRSYINGRSPEIRSNGQLTRDYLYVADAVDAYLSLAENMHREDVVGQSFNFGPNAPYTVLEIVQQIQKIMDCQHISPQILHGGAHEIPHQSLSSQKAVNILGWKLQFSLESGLKETIAWYQKYLNKEQVLCSFSSLV